jgi:hypothetical protein
VAAEVTRQDLEGSLLIRTPIVIVENGDLSIFASVEDVDAELEAVDVRAGRYVAYDATGRRLALTVAERRRVVVAEDPEAGPSDPDVLAAALRRYLEACGRSVPPDASLAELVRVAVDVVGYTAQ